MVITPEMRRKFKGYLRTASRMLAQEDWEHGVRSLSPMLAEQEYRSDPLLFTCISRLVDWGTCPLRIPTEAAKLYNEACESDGVL